MRERICPDFFFAPNVRDDLLECGDLARERYFRFCCDFPVLSNIFGRFFPSLFPKLAKKGTNVGKKKQTRGSVPEFVYEIGQKGNKRGGKGTSAGNR